MTKPTVTFETAALAAAVTRAARVAPTKGAAYDKAAGVVIEINPKGDHPITIKATDLEVTYLEWIEPLSIENITKKTVWRMPSQVFAGVLAGLPVSTGGTCELSDQGNGKLRVKAGKKVSNLAMVDAGVSYAKWEPFDPDGLELVPEFSRRVAEVSWAADTDSIPLTGVHITGDYLVATNKYKLARTPCSVPIDIDAIAASIEEGDPKLKAGKNFSPGITVPLTVVAPIFKNLTDAHLRAEERRMLIMPDEFTQITTTIYDSMYPPLGNVVRTDYPGRLTVEREPLREALLAMMVLCKSERYPRVDVTIGSGRLHLAMDVPGVGDMEDEIEVAGADHEDMVAYYSPTYFTDCLGAVKSNEVHFQYDPATPLRMPRISDDDRYEAWFAARKAIDPTE